MRTVTPTDMRKRLGEILDAASAGERILIERDHKPIAWLISPEDGRRFDEEKQQQIERSLAALDRLEALSVRLAAESQAPDDGLTDVEWIQQERERRMDRIDGLPHPSTEEDR